MGGRGVRSGAEGGETSAGSKDGKSQHNSRRGWRSSLWALNPAQTSDFGAEEATQPIRGESARRALSNPGRKAVNDDL